LNPARITLDPRQWQPGSPDAALGQQFAALVFDRLVSLDNYGRFQPQLAVSWSHDSESKHWQFVLRPNVVFSDGFPLTPTEVVAALTKLPANGKQFLAEGNSVVVQSASAMPDLLEELASGGAFVFRVLPNGELAGTGPFALSQVGTSAAGAFAGTVESGAAFVANERAWSGRPFLDAIEIVLGVPPGRQLLDLQMGKADLIELAPDLVHRAEEARLRTWTSRALEVVALVPGGQSPAAEDARLREALSLAIDRTTMAGVLLQRQAEPAGSLLPGWLTGYGSLFPVEINPDRARTLRAALPPNLAGADEPLWLTLDQEDRLMRLLAERVAINARQAGLNVRVASPAVSPALASGPEAGGLRLLRWHVSSLAPRVALDSLAAFLKVPDDSGAAGADPEQIFQRERAILDSRAAIPLVFLPETLALGAAVRNWMPSPWGAWHLENVWLDRSGSTPQGAHP
jgi:ABC-type transport system substrate-binding protein